jgi:hypothetical protein
MPALGVDERPVYLHDPQAYYFPHHQPIGRILTDKTGQVWQIESGLNDEDQQNLGLFDQGRLIARLSLSSSNLVEDCVTPFWSIGRSAVLHEFEGRGLMKRLMLAWLDEHGVPLASDLSQSPQAAWIWKKFVQEGRRVELYDENGSLGQVTHTDGRHLPDPWKHPEARLVIFPDRDTSFPIEPDVSRPATGAESR